MAYLYDTRKKQKKLSKMLAEESRNSENKIWMEMLNEVNYCVCFFQILSKKKR